jgi:hypothetical protein
LLRESCGSCKKKRRANVFSRRLAVVILLVILVLMLTAGVANAATDTVPSVIEAWYHTTPAPPPGPTGILLVNPYPAETLHVGITAGVEDARTYVSLDLAAIPGDKQIVGGVLTLPLNLDPAAGSLRPETATMIACFAPDPGVKTEGSPNAPPPADCSAKVPVVHSDSPFSTPRFTVDLSPFASTIGQFGSGLRSGAIAIMPNDAARSSAATWHVAFYGKNNPNQGAEKISATIFYDDAIATSDSDFDFDFGVEESFGDEFGGSSTELSSPLAFAPQENPTTAASPQRPDVRTQAGVFDEGGSAYLSWVLLVPIALLGFIGYFGRALTFDEEEVLEVSI